MAAPAAVRAPRDILVYESSALQRSHTYRQPASAFTETADNPIPICCAVCLKASASVGGTGQSRADAKAVHVGHCDVVAASKRKHFHSEALRSAEFHAVAQSGAQVALQTGKVRFGACAIIASEACI
mmetsp:Transcript_51707/g.102850  ORF Transcript_51707/g.102850 Transcript_51707/m.102850 type:complete len:127 (+) Transcript_51707:768-1148(+)